MEKKEIELTELSKDQLLDIKGGWNLIEYVVMGMGYLHGKLETPNTNKGWTPNYNILRGSKL